MINPLRENAQRARIIIIIFWLLAAIYAASLVSDFMQLQLLYQFSAGNVDRDAASNNDARQRLIWLASLVAELATIVFFIMWFRRAYCNLERTERVNLKYHEGWSAGAWFVPFLSLYRPYEIMKEIWHKTQEATYGLVQHRGGALVGWWWSVFLGSNTMNYISFRMRNHGDSIDSLISLTYFQMITTVFAIGSIVLTIFMISSASAIETKLYGSYTQSTGEGEDKLADIII